MSKTISIICIILSSQFSAAQEFLWANSNGSKGIDVVHSIFPIKNGYIMPVTYRDSFYALGKWNYSNNSINSMYLNFYTNTGKLRKLVKTENDSIYLSGFNSLEQGYLSTASANIFPGCFFNGEIYDPVKKQYVLELDTFGKITINLEIQCKSMGAFLEPKCGVSCNKRMKDKKLLSLNIRNTSNFNKTYYLNKKDSINIVPRENCVLFILEDSINKIISIKKLVAPIPTGVVVNYGSKYLAQSFINIPQDSFVFSGKKYFYESMNNCLILEFDSMLNLKKITRQVGEQFSLGSGFISISMIDTNLYFTANLAFVNKSEAKKIFILKDSIQLFRTTNTIINLQKRDKIITKLIRLKVNDLKSSLAVQSLSCTAFKEFCIITGQIGGECMIFPDSVIVHSNAGDGNFFMMKMDTFGNILWYYAFGKKGTSEYAANAIIEDDGVVVCGTFDSTTTLGNYTLTSNGGTDALIFKITDNSIYRGAIHPGPYCAGDSIIVPYRAYGKYNDTNTFFAELSDENGNFYGTPRVLGSLKSNALNGSITGVLPLFNVATSGKYRIRIRSNSPFVQSFMRYDSLYLLVYSKDKANPGKDTTICYGNKVQIGAKGGSIWHWSPGNMVADSTKRVTQFVGTLTTKLKITIADSSGCGDPDTAYQQITVLPAIKVFTTDTTVCRGDAFSLKARTTGGLADSMHVFWYRDTTLLGKDSAKASVYENTVFRVFATDGCSKSSDTTLLHVLLPNAPTLTTKDTVACRDNMLTWVGRGTGYQGRPVRVSWYKGSQFLANDTLRMIPDSAEQFVLRGDDGCAVEIGSKNVGLSLYQQPTFIAVADSLCARDSHTISFQAISGKSPYEYYFGNNKILSGFKLKADTYNRYEFEMMDACGAKSHDTLILGAIPVSVFTTAPKAGCSPINITLVATPGKYKRYWVTPDGGRMSLSSDTLSATHINTGYYTYKLISENGLCLDSSVQKIQVWPNPVAAFEIQGRNLLAGEATTRAINTSEGALRYYWYWQNQKRIDSILRTIELSFVDSGKAQIMLVAQNNFGCSDTAIDFIYVHPQPIVWIPTGLTLNQDGLNDRLEPGGVGIKTYRFLVLNKWGEIVFRGADNEPWQPDEKVLPGMYVYRCIYSNWKGTKFEQNGTVLVIK